MQKMERITPKESKYCYGDFFAQEQEEIPAVRLEKMGFGNLNLLYKLVKKGELKGRLEKVQTPEGEKTAVYVDLKDYKTPEILNKIRANTPVSNLSQFAKELGLTQKQLLQYALDGEVDFLSSVRRTIYEFFMSQPERNGFMDALKWLIFEEYNAPNVKDTWHLATCPNCNEGVDIQRHKIQSDYTIKCPHCGEKIYLTDVLRLHEAIDNELGAGGILGYLTTTVEQIIIVYLIKQMLTIRPSLLEQTLFVKDGPLAFFGQTANLHKPMRQLMIFLNEHHAIYLVGLEKSGSFVEHAVQASKRMLPKQMLLLGNSYIYKYIIPGNGRDNEPYASSSYYGHKVIFKSEHNNVYVATIPNTQAKVEPQIDDYININEILYNITALKCDLYYNSLVPVVLANKLVSLADHPSSDLLKSFAKEKINK